MNPPNFSYARQWVKKSKNRFATIACASDPFRVGLYIRPFLWGFYDGEAYHQFWGDDCTSDLMNFLRKYEYPLIIHPSEFSMMAWEFIKKYSDEDTIKSINGNCVQCDFMHHRFYDIFSNMPIRTQMIQSFGGIDRNFLERRRRERHKKSICKYIEGDYINFFNRVKKESFEETRSWLCKQDIIIK